MPYSDRRNFFICLTVILLLSIPLCCFVFLMPPKVTIFWWADDGSPSVDPSGAADSGSPPLLLLVSYDGFRYDYVERTNNTPTFRWLIKNGVYATEGLKNSYITITAPNHWGIVTGLFEETHGVVANDFYDPVLKERFDYFDSRWKTDPRMFTGVPVWNLNDQKYATQGGGTGCVMWVGCDVPIQGHLPLHYVSWDENLAWTARVDALIAWFKHPDRPVNFGILYIEEPDETGHRYGPDSPHITEMVEKMDQLTSYLMWRLYTEKLLDRMNIIFTADHGMSVVPTLNVINMDNYVNRSLYTVYGGTPNWNVDPKPGHEAEVYNALKNKVPHLNVYNKTDIPPDFHYRNNSRIMPIQLLADVHWWISYNYSGGAGENSERNSALKDDASTTNNAKPDILQMKLRGKTITLNLTASNYSTGHHGYNNSVPEMHPYFIGYGPAFKKGYNITQFWNLDLFPLMCYILGVDPTPNNGSFERVRKILKDEGRRWSSRNYRPYPSTLRPDTAGAAGVTVEYEYSSGSEGYLSYLYTTNLDFLVMFLLVLGYVAFMFSMAKSLKRKDYSFATTVPSTQAKSLDEKQDTSIFSA